MVQKNEMNDQACHQKVQTFIDNCLRRILRIHLSDKISNIDPWKKKKQLPVEHEMRRKRERWIGQNYDLKPSVGEIKGSTKAYLACGPPGRHQKTGCTWSQKETRLTNREQWQFLTDSILYIPVGMKRLKKNL